MATPAVHPSRHGTACSPGIRHSSLQPSPASSTATCCQSRYPNRQHRSVGCHTCMMATLSASVYRALSMEKSDGTPLRIMPSRNSSACLRNESPFDKEMRVNKHAQWLTCRPLHPAAVPDETSSALRLGMCARGYSCRKAVYSSVDRMQEQNKRQNTRPCRVVVQVYT